MSFPVPLTLPLVSWLVPLTLPSFLLVIAPLFLSSITSHPLHQSPFLPPPSLSDPSSSFSLSSSFNSIPPTLLSTQYLPTHCFSCNFSSSFLIGCSVQLICQARPVKNTTPHSFFSRYLAAFSFTFQCLMPNLGQDLVGPPQMQSLVQVRRRRWRQHLDPAPARLATQRRAPSSSTPTTTASPRASTWSTRASCGLSP